MQHRFAKYHAIDARMFQTRLVLAPRDRNIKMRFQ